MDESLSFIFIFYFIGNQRTIINEKKRKVQAVHDDEQEETKETNNKTKDREIRKINYGKTKTLKETKNQ